MPFGINLRDYRARNIESSSYIFSGGRTARDFGTLFKLANKINSNFVVVTGYPAWSEINLRSIPKNVTVYFEVPENDYEELLLKSKFVVLTLHDVPYSCGLSSLLQAMAAGKAVIVTKTSSTLDYVSNWNTGIFVRPYDVNDLRDKIKYLLKNPKKAEEIGANGRWTVETLFNERNMAKNIIKVLTSVHREENTSADLINRRS
jgi:glycosyltransferase involved in cell wall biosynthesis